MGKPGWDINIWWWKQSPICPYFLIECMRWTVKKKQNPKLSETLEEILVNDCKVIKLMDLLKNAGLW